MKWSDPLINSIAPQDTPQILNLCNEAFEKTKYFEALPQLFYPGNLENQFLFKDSTGQCIAYCSFHPFVFPNLRANELVKSYCVGNVCTKKEFQGRGVGSLMLQYIEEVARKRNVDFLFLFSLKQKLYLNNGYLPIGDVLVANIWEDSVNKKKITTFQHSVSKKFKRSHFMTNTCELKEDVKVKLWNFLVKQQRSCEPILSYSEFCTILTIQPFIVFYTLENNDISCFCFIEKGGDFENCLHGFFYKNEEDIILLIKEMHSRFKIYPKTIFFSVYDQWMSKNFRCQNSPCLFVKSVDEVKYSTKDLSKKLNSHNLFINTLQGA